MKHSSHTNELEVLMSGRHRLRVKKIDTLEVRYGKGIPQFFTRILVEEVE
jgi:hypothetical protein